MKSRGAMLISSISHRTCGPLAVESLWVKSQQGDFNGWVQSEDVSGRLWHGNQALFRWGQAWHGNPWYSETIVSICVAYFCLSFKEIWQVTQQAFKEKKFILCLHELPSEKNIADRVFIRKYWAFFCTLAPNFQHFLSHSFSSSCLSLSQLALHQTLREETQA